MVKVGIKNKCYDLINAVRTLKQLHTLTLICNLPGDMDKLDPYVRRKMAQRLDPSIGADWRELARRLGLGTLERAFAIHPSPTTQVLAQYEVIRGSQDTYTGNCYVMIRVAGCIMQQRHGREC